MGDCCAALQIIAVLADVKCNVKGPLRIFTFFLGSCVSYKEDIRMEINKKSPSLPNIVFIAYVLCLHPHFIAFCTSSRTDDSNMKQKQHDALLYPNSHQAELEIERTDDHRQRFSLSLLCNGPDDCIECVHWLVKCLPRMFYDERKQTVVLSWMQVLSLMRMLLLLLLLLVVVVVLYNQ